MMEHAVIRMIADGLPLEAALCQVCRTLEADCADGARASVMRYDPATHALRLVAWAGLPEGYATAVRALGDIPVAPRGGSCGTAAFRRQTVIVDDIATDPLWEGTREMPLDHGLRSCWSTPVLSSRGDLLGTLALYRRHPHRMEAHDFEVLRRAARLAAAAFEADGVMFEAEPEGAVA